MKKLSLQVLMIVCGILAGINVFATIIGVLCLDLTLVVFYGIFAAIFIFANRKLAAKVKVIKAEAPKEKVKVEPVKDKVINLNNHKEEPKKEKVSLKEKICAKLDEWSANLEEKRKKLNEQDPKDNALIWKILDTIGAILLPILFVAAIIGLIIGAGALVFWLFNVIIGIIGAIIGFIFNAFMYVIGFIAAIFIIGGFLSFWWDLVKWEHVYKPRGYVRVKRRRRR